VDKKNKLEKPLLTENIPVESANGINLRKEELIYVAANDSYPLADIGRTSVTSTC
jgi:hypothetical protein